VIVERIITASFRTKILNKKMKERNRRKSAKRRERKVMKNISSI